MATDEKREGASLTDEERAQRARMIERDRAQKRAREEKALKEMMEYSGRYEEFNDAIAASQDAPHDIVLRTHHLQRAEQILSRERTIRGEGAFR